MRRGPLVIVGDSLLDRDLTGQADRLSPDAPVPVLSQLSEVTRPGGAGLAALLAATDGHEVVLVTALGTDPAADRLRQLLEQAGVLVCAGQLAGGTPEKVRVRCGGQSLLRLDWGDRSARVSVTAAMREPIRAAAAVLVADYGGGLVTDTAVREWLSAAAGEVPMVWDPHSAGAAPVPGVRVATPNLGEAVASTGPADAVPDGSPAGSAILPTVCTGASTGTATDALAGGAVGVAARAARSLLSRWQAHGVAVTLGAGGALLASPQDVPLVVPARPVTATDTCGAGDRFSATVAGMLADGALPSEAVIAGVEAASAYVAAGGASAVRVQPRHQDARTSRPHRTGTCSAEDAVRRTRAAGGTVVATGGCFDLLHAGHVRTLEAARRLGDCLVVCVNSDESVRRLKGPQRPVVPVRDRVRVLAALGCVDAVTVFDEDTPLEVLDLIRPDIWVKGGDYSAPALVETDLLARWGGEVVVVPYLEGHSTTGLVRAAASRSGPGRAGSAGSRRGRANPASSRHPA